MTQGWSVPVVDIGAYVDEGREEERSRVAEAFDRACREVGFVQVFGHGVPEQTIAGLANAMDALFDQPLETKQAYRTPPEVNRGYTPPKSESLSLSLGVEQASRMNDFFEAFNVGVPASTYPSLTLPEEHYPDNVWPRQPEGFAEAVGAYFTEAARVAETLTDVAADALSLPHGFFDEYTDHSCDVLRMNNYALPPGRLELDGDLTGMGEHTDYGIVTVLWADDAPGLQVLGTDNLWHDVSPLPGALLVNLGDLTARWTNERWMSTMHRVKPPIVNGTIRRRRSAAYFRDGNTDAVVSTLPTCREADGSSRYEPIRIGDHVAAKLAGSRAGRANLTATREADRVRAAQP
ncbi:MAG TPA: 2-oxoglutarate and iron-dependent oxygenase domain-containing protein [Nocardioidaceae bacterium]|nr:2-oxoglutarate and iron-dependent oxygenase domain-containing protein [Nocardioidaceae bacterium]